MSCRKKANPGRRFGSAMKLTLFTQRVVGGARVFACGQRAGKQQVTGGRLVLGAGEGGVSATAAQGLV